MKENKIPNNNQNNDEIDLRELFKLVKEGVENVWEWFLSLLVRLFCFVKKNLVFLVLGCLLGLGLGLYNYYNFTPQKVYKMVVSPNSISRVYLYDKIKSYQEGNEEDRDYTVVIEPVKDYKESSRILFDELKDTPKEIAEKVEIQQFLTSIKDYEYKDHVISIYSDKKIDVNKFQKTIVSSVENSSLIIKKQKEELLILNRLKKNIELNLANINKTIDKDLQKNESSNGELILMEGQSKTTIFDSYQRLSEELSNVQRKIDDQSEILRVLSDLGYVGETSFADDLSHLNPKKSSARVSFVKFILLGLGFAIVLLLLIAMLKFFLRKSK